MSLEHLQLISKLQVVYPDIALPVTCGQVLTIGTDFQRPHAFLLSVSRVRLVRFTRCVEFNVEQIRVFSIRVQDL